MVRPKVPLISKRTTLETALRIIDDEGLDAMSVRRLAQELNVTSASLYHHFRNKDEIIVGAAKVALDEVRTPRSYDEPWPKWTMRTWERHRKALVAHPNLIPIFLDREFFNIGQAEMDEGAAHLRKEGVPLGTIAPLLEFGEILALVGALAETRRKKAGQHLPSTAYPNLREAAKARNISTNRLLVQIYEAAAEVLVSAGIEKSGASGPVKNAAKVPKARADGNSAKVKNRSSSD